MSKRQRAEESSVEKEQRQTHSDHAHWVVFVLVKTADKEGDDDDDENDNEFGECKAESDVIGVYRSHSQAEKSKDKETEGMETSDGFTFHTPNGGKPYYTTFEIHKEIVQDNDDDDDGDDEDDDDEVEEEDSDINDEEDDQRDSDDDDEPDSDENDEVDSDDDDNVEDDEEEGGGRKEEPKQSSFNGPSSRSGIMEGQRYDSDVDEFMDSEDEKDSDDDDDVVEVVQLPPDDDDDDDDDDVDDDDDDDGVPVQGQGGDWSGRPGHHCELCNRSSEGVGPRRGFDYKLNVCGGCVELD